MDGAALIAARVATYATMMLAAGMPLYLAIARRQASQERAACRLACIAAMIALPASAWWALQSIASMAALPLGELDRDTIVAVLDATPLGKVLAVRSIALLIAAVALWHGRAAAGALVASLGLATTAWTGHAGASEAGLGMLHRTADVAHLLTAATWLGALCLFLMSAIGGKDRQALVRHLSGFAATGSVIVLLLLLTGLANTLIIAGWPPDPGTDWFRMLGAKFAMFLTMLALAACNRWRLTPALARDPSGDLRKLKLSLVAETGAALAIVAIVGWLGTLSPV
jgi:putative copper resistance protein D